MGIVFLHGTIETGKQPDERLAETNAGRGRSCQGISLHPAIYIRTLRVFPMAGCRGSEHGW